MPLVSGGVPTRQRGAPKRPAVLGWVAAVFGRFLQFAVEPVLLLGGAGLLSVTVPRRMAVLVA